MYMEKKSIRYPRTTVFFCLITALLCTPALAINALVTDISGEDYNVLSVKLIKGSTFKVVCGGTKMEVPFKSVSSMRIAQGLISSVDGQLYFAVEIRTSDGAVIGNFEGDKRCYVYADNGFVGKTASKSKFNSPLSNVSAVSIVGKGAEKKGGKEDDEDESEE
jgi:hypothetical protein